MIVALIALVIGVVALALPFVLGGKGEMESRITSLEAKSGASLKIAYLDAESALKVFDEAVKDLSQKAQDKASEIIQLQQQYTGGSVTKQDFDNRNNQLQAELLQAQVAIDSGMLEKMIAAPGFSDIRPQLQKIREQAQPMIDETKNLVSTARVGVVNAADFQNRYNTVKNVYSQLAQLLAQAAMAKVEQASQKVGVQNGYDLVLLKKNVLMYLNTARLTDVTDLVKRELASYL